MAKRSKPRPSSAPRLTPAQILYAQDGIVDLMKTEIIDVSKARVEPVDLMKTSGT